VTAIEDRLRAAFHADADTIAHPPPCPGRASFRPGGQFTHRRIWIPLAAAASVAAVIVGAAVIAPKMYAARDHGAASTGRSPKFLAAIELRPTPALDIISAATGHVTGQVAAPVRGERFIGVVTAGSDRAFVAAVLSPKSCATSFYYLRLTTAGAVSRIQPYARPLTKTYPADLAVSSNLRVLAYVTEPCNPTASGGDPYGLSLTHLGGRGYTRRWIFRRGGPSSVSLTANGRVAGFVSNSVVPSRQDLVESEWLLPTDSPSGLVQRHYRQVVSPRTRSGSLSCVLSPSGGSTLCATPTQIASYHTASGHEIRIWRTYPDKYGLAPTLSLSASGRYLLVTYLGPGEHRAYGIDLETGRSIKLPKAVTDFVLSVAW
jgi:hypothetical protein